MKKIAIFLIVALLLCGCAGKGASAPATVEMDLETLVDKIYENHHEMELPIMNMPLDLEAEGATQYNLGLATADGVKEALISETMIGAQPYSLVLVRVEDAANAGKIAGEMKNGIDTRKWVCVEADDMQVVYYGDVVMLFMVGSDYADQATSQEMVDAFAAAVGGTVTAA